MRALLKAEDRWGSHALVTKRQQTEQQAWFMALAPFRRPHPLAEMTLWQAAPTGGDQTAINIPSCINSQLLNHFRQGLF